MTTRDAFFRLLDRERRYNDGVAAAFRVLQQRNLSEQERKTYEDATRKFLQKKYETTNLLQQFHATHPVEAARYLKEYKKQK